MSKSGLHHVTQKSLSVKLRNHIPLEPEQQEQGNKSQEGLEQIGSDITLESWVDDMKGHHIEKMNLIP